MKAYAHQTRILNETLEDLRAYGYHAIFAEVGTGKSKMLIDTFAELWMEREVDAIIIAAPKALAGTWKEQLSIHCTTDGWELATFDSTHAKTAKWQKGFEHVSKANLPILFVNTEAFQAMPDVLISVLEIFMSGRKILLAIDESNDIKGPKAKRALNLTKLGKRCQYRIIMTGTEITHSVLDLYQQFEFLSEGYFGFHSFFMFKNYYAILEDRYISGGRSFKEVKGFRKLDQLQQLVERHTSRARKKDCLDLPEKIHANMPVALTGESKRVYGELKDRLFAMLKSGEILTVPNKIALFTKFRQITGGTLAGSGTIDSRNSKLEALMSELEDSNEQAIIWSCFREEIDLIFGILNKLYPCVRFDGTTSDTGRETAISLFREGKARLFIANPAAASQGLNLQTAHIQYWYSLPTQAKHYEQGEGRIHRSGQTEACVYKKILAEDTVDYRIAELLDEKTDVMAAFRDGTLDDVIKMI